MIAIIPARGGSKGLKNKNILPMNGKPLILHTVDAAIKSGVFEHIIVSTDSQEIARVCKDVPDVQVMMRPDELSSDAAGTLDVCFYVLEKQLSQVIRNKDFVILQPTSPLRRSKDIVEAVKIFNKYKADSVISVCESIHPYQWLMIINDRGRMVNQFEDADEQRQAYAKSFMPNGAVYVCRFEVIKKQQRVTMDQTYPYIMPKHASVDIDDLSDFIQAEAFMRAIEEGRLSE